MSLLTFCLVTVAPSRALALAPNHGFECLLDAADEYSAQGRHDQALVIYVDAFDSMPTHLRAGGVGELVALAVGDAALADYRDRGDVRSLELGRRVLLEFIAAVDAAEPELESVSTIAVEAKLRALELEMRDASPAGAERPEELDDEPGEANTETSRRASDGARFTDDARPRVGGMGKAGIGLLAVGGASMFTGTILALRQPEHFPLGHPDANKIRTTRPPGIAMLGGGAAVAVVGAVLLAVDIKRRERNEEAASRPVAAFQSWVDSEHFGLGVVGRF